MAKKPRKRRDRPADNKAALGDGFELSNLAADSSRGQKLEEGFGEGLENVEQDSSAQPQSSAGEVIAAPDTSESPPPVAVDQRPPGGSSPPPAGPDAADGEDGEPTPDRPPPDTEPTVAERADWSRDELGLFLGVLGLALSELGVLISLPFWQRIVAAVITTVVGIPLVSAVAPGVNRLMNFLLTPRSLPEIFRVLRRNWQQGKVTSWLAPQRIAIFALIALTAFLWTVIWKQQKEIVKQRKIEASEDISQRATKAEEAGRPGAALLLALEANRIWPTADAHSDLLNILTVQPGLEVVLADPAGSETTSSAQIPGGSAIATAHQSGALYVWADGVPTTLREAGDPIVAMAMQRDGAFLATADESGQLLIWSLTDRAAPTNIARIKGTIRDIAVSGDGDIVGVASSAGVSIVDRVSGRETFRPFGASVQAIAGASKGRRFVIGGAGIVALLDADRGDTRQFTGIADFVLEVAFVPGSTEDVIFAASDRVWSGNPEGDSFSPVHPMTGLTGLADLTVDHQAGLVAVVADQGTSVWQWGRLPVPIRDLTVLATPHGAGFTADGRLVVTTSENSQVLALEPGSLSTQVASGLRAGRSLAADPATGTAVSGHADGSVIFWNLKAEPHESYVPESPHTGAVDAVEIIDDGRYVVTGDRDGLLATWFVTDGAAPALVDRTDTASRVRDVVTAGDNRLITAHADNVIKIWHLRNGEVEHQRDIQTESPVWAITHSEKSGLVAAADDDGIVSLWDPENAHLVESTDPFSSRVRQAAYSPDGTHLAIATQTGLLAILDGATLDVLFETDRTDIWSLGWSRAGNILAVGVDSNLQLFTFSSESHALTDLGTPLSGHTGNLRGMGLVAEFVVLTLDTDGSVREWDLSLPALQERACSIANRNTSAAELTTSENIRRDNQLNSSRQYVNFCPEHAPNPDYTDAEPYVLEGDT